MKKSVTYGNKGEMLACGDKGEMLACFLLFPVYLYIFIETRLLAN